jgi:hypothetical protein
VLIAIKPFCNRGLGQWKPSCGRKSLLPLRNLRAEHNLWDTTYLSGWGVNPKWEMKPKWELKPEREMRPKWELRPYTGDEAATDLSRIAEIRDHPIQVVWNRYPGSLDRKIEEGCHAGGLKYR